MDGKTILFVEDDKALAMGTVFVLEAEGYTVRHAANIRSANELLDDKVTDLDRKRQVLTEVQNQLSRMEWMVLSLLKLARIEAGAIERAIS